MLALPQIVVPWTITAAAPWACRLPWITSAPSEAHPMSGEQPIAAAP
jgi:hypothetical protein